MEWKYEVKQKLLSCCCFILKRQTVIWSHIYISGRYVSFYNKGAYVEGKTDYKDEFALPRLVVQVSSRIGTLCGVALDQLARHHR